ncbi:MAG: hypothetical protein PW999_09690 [Paraburkholderia tropica]|nr:hypothetical protein [Paraburkholderia tropica]
MSTREQFEAWKRTVPPVHAEEVEKMFRAWQASRAAALEEAAPKIDAHMRKQYGETRGAGDFIRALAKAEGD